MIAVSKIDPNITEDYFLHSKESLYFERKGRDTKTSKIANEIIGMLNADGGVIAVGIEDDGTFDDSKKFRSNTNEYRKICQEMIKPSPHIQIEEIVINGNIVYLYHILEK